MPEKRKTVSFEQAVVRLESIVQKLEEESVTLEESLKLFEEGVTLAELCRRQLDEAEEKIKTLTRNESGKLQTKSQGSGE